MKRLGVRTVVQDVQRGTGHAVLQTYPLLRGFRGSVLVVSGDTPLVSAETIRLVTDTHASHSNAITLGTARVPDPKGYGRILRDERGAFAGIVEERDADPATRRISEINGGLYCFRASALFDGLLLLTADNSQMEYYLTDAIGIVKSRGGRVEALLVDDHTEFAGVNTPHELAQVRKLHSKKIGRKVAR
jgi:bifunctional UDP-N-acetylglucosamine pyrophosphorylase/glucosamine-1-phosphate N-acetyltransferase